MKKTTSALIFLSGLLAACIYFIAKWHWCGDLIARGSNCHEVVIFTQFYGDKIRGSLFAGFLTLGGFLLSLKTFIVVNMKKEVFDTDEYQSLWDEVKKLDHAGELEYKYSPLRYLSTVLYLAIVACISTAVLQLTIGLINNLWAVVICLWAVLLALMFLIWALLLIRKNLTIMFDYLDRKDGKR